MPLYLPWWAGGACLALVTVGSCIVARRPLGVSGILARFVNLTDELAAQRSRSVAAAANEATFEEALLAATAEAFGPGALGATCDVAAPSSAVALPGVTDPDLYQACAGECASASARPTLGAHAVFLGAIVVGGFLAQLARGGWSLSLDLGPTFARVVGMRSRGAAALLLGGLLVGIGTTISGGCSTGHGLSGCSRLQPAGVAATVSFMSTAVLVSLWLAGRVS